MALVEFERRGEIAIVTLNRPEARNAINGDMARSIGAAMAEAEHDPDVRVTVLAATVTEPRPVFCAGDDLRALETGGLDGSGDQPVTEEGGFAGFVRLPRSKPVIAAVDGLATSGGLEIVLACDLVVATRRSSFALAEVRWNLVAGAGGLFRLPWAVGRTTAMDMLLTGEPIDAERAYQLGLVGTLVDVDATGAAVARAKRIVSNGPLAVTASRTVCDRAFSVAEAELWTLNDEAVASVLRSDDVAVGLAAFADRVVPKFSGR